ncbi:MAG: tRNA (adenosine(37)-N6)-threonylcarbamoyltransferase complex ATPase subunit type 1 TsaE [Erysipelotrichaceae bacterium]|nr:tRNA (adenosine(37)-N6)-threonylcarbamoyltransferase complex ATPase subunit type 1 TsaE [Erysipelotrichaceae bacterium]
MITRNEQETIAAGEKLGKLLNQGDIIALKGDLAGGKTTFTKGIGKALNIKEVINSPTFTILKIYKGDKYLYHIDAYRLENNEYDLGIGEYEDEGIMVIEWPEYYKRYLPEEYLEVDFTYLDDESRQIDFTAHGQRYEQIAEVMNDDTMY